MPDTGYVVRASAASLQRDVRRHTSGSHRRAVLLVIVAVAAVAGFLVTDPAAASQAAAQSGLDLVRLLRAMAGIKAIAAIGLVAVTYWRFATPVSPARFAVYALACGAMAAGPGLIWGIVHLKPGALLLHGGLLAVGMVLWFDPGMTARLGAEIARRRARLRT